MWVTYPEKKTVGGGLCEPDGHLEYTPKHLILWAAPP